MKRLLMAAMAAIVVSGSAMAQSTKPMVGDKPLLQVQPKGAKGAAKQAAAPKGPTSVAGKLQACLEIDDESKERLNCYDAVIKPQGKAKPPVAKTVSDCRFHKEEDERLTCFNKFVDKGPKPEPKAEPKT